MSDDSKGDGGDAESAADGGPQSRSDPQAGRDDFTHIGGVYISESYYLECVRHVTMLIPNKAAFGPYVIEDLRSEACLWCIKALPFWDPSRCLKNFLYRHVQNRLINFRRDNLIRNDPPCRDCHAGKFCGAPADEGSQVCSRYKAWTLRNSAKHCLAQAAVACEPLTFTCQARERPVLEELEKRELFERFDDEIPLHLRSLYLKAREGSKLSQKEYRAVVEALREIAGVGDADESEDESEDESDE